MKIKEYKIVEIERTEGDGRIKTNSQMQELISLGYEPYADPYVIRSIHGPFIHCQAMVLIDKTN